MTRAELRNLTLYWLDDDSGGYFTSTIVNAWLNLAQREVQKRLLKAGENFYLSPVETVLVPDQADYVLPGDFVTLHRIEIILSGTGVNEDRFELTPMTLNQQDQTSIAASTPETYVMGKDRITLFPTPDQALTMRLYYSPLVADMSSDSDEPDVPEQYQELIALLAAENGFIKDDRVPSNLKAKLDEYKKDLDALADQRKQDRSRRVVTRERFSDSDY